MLPLLFSRLGNPDSERLKDFAQGHSVLVAEAREEPNREFSTENINSPLESTADGGGTAPPLVSRVVSPFRNPIKAERINTFQKG